MHQVFCLHACMLTTHAPHVQQGQKRMVDSLELGLLMVVSHHVGVGTQTWNPVKNNKCTQLLSQLSSP